MKQTDASIAFTSPHFAATQAGQAVLEQGGTAIEAMVAAAASIAVEYPHMNGLGGDGFWLISEPGKKPIGIDASGCAAGLASSAFYPDLSAIPSRGGQAAVTMAGAVSGWQRALALSSQWQPNMSLESLLSVAINQAKWGIEVTQSLSDASFKTFDDLAALPGFEQFLIKGKALKKGKILKLTKLADTLDHLAREGLDSFYHGDIATQLSQELEAAGSPIRREDFEAYQAQIVGPLSVTTSKGTLYNLGAPTQGVASLIIQALYDRVVHLAKDEADHVHLLIEATKQAFIVRNQNVTDPSKLSQPLDSFLTSDYLNELAANIKLERALPWPHQAAHGDTIWMAASDNQGRMVSYIQSLYWEFGSGIVSPTTGIVWNNRGTSFTLDDGLNGLAPGLKPFHTLNPAFAELLDGRRISYGTMGGEGQPQTQSAIMARHLYQDFPLSEAVSRGRWLLGRTWGDQSHNLKVEADLAEVLAPELETRGHELVTVEARNELMGHAGAIVRFPDGHCSATSDPRSDGKAYPDDY